VAEVAADGETRGAVRHRDGRALQLDVAELGGTLARGGAADEVDLADALLREGEADAALFLAHDACEARRLRRLRRRRLCRAFVAEGVGDAEAMLAAAADEIERLENR
jgi:hypothetical protein